MTLRSGLCAPPQFTEKLHIFLHWLVDCKNLRPLAPGAPKQIRMCYIPKIRTQRRAFSHICRFCLTWIPGATGASFWICAYRLLRESRGCCCCRYNTSVSSSPSPSLPPPLVSGSPSSSRTYLPGASSCSSTWRCSSSAQLLPLSGSGQVGDASATAAALRIRSHRRTGRVKSQQ